MVVFVGNVQRCICVELHYSRGQSASHPRRGCQTWCDRHSQIESPYLTVRHLDLGELKRDEKVVQYGRRGMLWATEEAVMRKNECGPQRNRRLKESQPFGPGYQSMNQRGWSFRSKAQSKLSWEGRMLSSKSKQKIILGSQATLETTESREE